MATLGRYGGEAWFNWVTATWARTSTGRRAAEAAPP